LQIKWEIKKKSIYVVQQTCQIGHFHDIKTDSVMSLFYRFHGTLSQVMQGSQGWH
jgi:hypothetical protein